MPSPLSTAPDSVSPSGATGEKHYQVLFRKHIARLLLTYCAPLVLLVVYFQVQYSALLSESRSLHLQSIAENHANLLDLFLRERLVNLNNLIDDPRLSMPPTRNLMQVFLDKLKRDSDTFIDIGYFDSSGVQLAYAGPLPELEKKNYSHELWFIALRTSAHQYIITDIYPGFRQMPHFTLGVSRIINHQYTVLRATLDPKKIYEYMTSLEGSTDFFVSIVNRDGHYQVTPPSTGSVFEALPVLPPESPRIGLNQTTHKKQSVTVGYAWMHTADWAVLVQWMSPNPRHSFFGMQTNLIAFSLIIILTIVTIIIFRAKKLVAVEREKDIAQSQLARAHKLALVGELAAGIAHEINNPLGIIASEAGLMKDFMDPQFRLKTTLQDLEPHLDNIQEAAFRCRDITSKLLSFVRKKDEEVRPHNVHQLLDGVIDGFWTHEMTVSNITIIRQYHDHLPTVMADGRQLQQVFLNILNNAVDAITPPGTVTITTACNEKYISIAMADSGKGMMTDQIEKIFLPFYTTKGVGKGTGLGLSVSYGIIRNMGGTVEVKSIPGAGSTFTIQIPSASYE